MRVFLTLILFKVVLCAVEDMIYCVRMGLADELEDWLKAGEDPNQFDYSGMSPLACACQNTYLNMVQVLVKYGANPEKCHVNGGDTCLGNAIGYGNWYIAKVLLENGADPNILDDAGFPPLHCAIRLDRIISAKMLIKHGANVDITFKDGMTPLGLAASTGSFDSAMHLVENLGLNPYADANSTGQNAVQIARSKGHTYLADAMEIHARSMLLSCAETDFGSLFSTDMVSDCTEMIRSTFASQICRLRDSAYARPDYSFFFDP